VDLSQKLRTTLVQRRRADLYRSRHIVEGPQQPEMIVDGKRVISFCSNDYLGLANHPKVIAAFKRGAGQYGVGSGAAHLINGHSRAHHALEEELADFTGRERALLFSTGYMANLGIVSALLKRGDTAFADRLNHASLLDAGLLSGARLIRYRHRDTLHLEKKIFNREAGEKLILTDGVFSMDGDIAPLPKLTKIAQIHHAWLMVDDAHGLGVIGNTGRGVLEHYGIGEEQVPILMGTLGKAFGTFGAFVAGSEALIETLIQSARTYIYTTAPPPALAEATRASLRIAAEESWRREHLAGLTRKFIDQAKLLNLDITVSTTPIQIIPTGSSLKAVQIHQALLDRGFLVTAIRPPTVPKGTARLRVTLSACHTEKQVEHLVEALASIVFS
jgi:8-amino-7-oxononanoate synthase